jgi:hypothetical protein
MALAQVTTFGEGQVVSALDLIAAVREALVDALQVPADDPTVWYRPVPAGYAAVSAHHGPDAVLVEVTMFAGRSSETIAPLAPADQ